MQRNSCEILIIKILEMSTDLIEEKLKKDEEWKGEFFGFRMLFSD